MVEAEDVARHLETDLERGLSAAEAARRCVADGPNEIIPVQPVPTWRKILGHFQDPLVYLLIVAVVVSLVVWLVEGAEGWPVDALVIAVIVVANAVLGYVQQARAEHAVEALQRLTAATATVVRDGKKASEARSCRRCGHRGRPPRARGGGHGRGRCPSDRGGCAEDRRGLAHRRK